jgi:hypothetical protein
VSGDQNFRIFVQFISEFSVSHGTKKMLQFMVNRHFLTKSICLGILQNFFRETVIGHWVSKKVNAYTTEASIRVSSQRIWW